jgi:hypothetical protein
MSVVYAVSFTLVIALLGLFTVGFAGVLFSAAFVGGFVVWIATTHRTPIDAKRIIVPYLVLVIIFVILVQEEYVTHIEVSLSELSGFSVTQGQFPAIAAFSARSSGLSGR